MKMLFRFLFLVAAAQSLLDNSYGQEVLNGSIPKFEIVANNITVAGKSDLRQRDVFVLLLEDGVSKESFARLFSWIESKNCDPYNLNIIAYNDKAMLEKHIQYKKTPIFIDFVNDEDGRKAANAYHQKIYPAPSGYLRGIYFRYATFEYFDFSPDKDQIAMERVNLRSEQPLMVDRRPMSSACKLTDD